MCAVLKVSSSGYYAWRKRTASQRDQHNALLVERMRAIQKACRGTYGSPRMTAELRAQGIVCNRKRVARLMRLHGLNVQLRRRHKRTTRSNPNALAAPNHLNRDFRATAPNRKWLSDITYIQTREGWLYLAVVLDLFSRKIVGWAMSTHINDRLTCAALQMAIQHRQPAPGKLLHHSDRGAQYTALQYRDTLAQIQAQISMSRRGDCYDNAPPESFFATLKTELIHRTVYLTRNQARADIFDYIEVFYNRFRRHSALHFLSPCDFELACAD